MSTPVQETTTMPRVRDLMQPSVIDVPATMSAVEAARLLTDHRISGAPVVTDEGNVVGVISLYDLARLHGMPRRAPSASPWLDPDTLLDYLNGFSGDDEAAFGTVADVMSTALVEIAPGASLRELVRVMCEAKVHRVLVVDNRRLVGIVTSMDVMRIVPQLLDVVREALIG